MLKVKISRRPAIYGVLIAIFLAFFVRSKCEADVEHARKIADILPENIQISDVIFVKDNSGARETCGAAIFKLADSTKLAIEKQGLSYFKNSLKPVANQKFVYNDWQITPIPKQWTNEGLWYGLDCVKGQDELVRRVFESANGAGGYYTYAPPNRRLVVLPALGVAVYSWG